MTATKEDLDNLLREVRATRAMVEALLARDSGEKPSHPDDIAHYNVIGLALHPIIQEWCKDVGLSTYECEVLGEGTIAGSLRREVLFDGLKMGVRSAVFRMHHDPEQTGEAVRAWAADEEPDEDRALPMTVDKLAAYIEAEAAQLESTAALCEVDEDMEAALRLRGKAEGIREIGTVVIAGLRKVLGEPKQAEPKQGASCTAEAPCDHCAQPAWGCPTCRHFSADGQCFSSFRPVEKNEPCPYYVGVNDD